MRQMMMIGAVAVALLGCNKKADETKGKDEAAAKKAPAEKPLELVDTELVALGLTMKAPKGATIEGDKARLTVRSGAGFQLEISEAIFKGVGGKDLITGAERRGLDKVLTDEPNLQVWTKKPPMGGAGFRMVLKTGGKELWVAADMLGRFTKAQVDVMLKAAKTITAK